MSSVHRLVENQPIPLSVSLLKTMLITQWTMVSFKRAVVEFPSSFLSII